MSLERRSLRSWLASGWLIAALLGGSMLSAAADGGGLAALAGPLKALAVPAERGGVNTLAASRLGLSLRGGMVQVEVLFQSPAGAAATSLGRYGAVTELRQDRRVQACVPTDQLLAVASLPQVAQIRPSEPMLPLQGFGAVTSEGVQLTNATAMHLAGVTGKGAKVAIIDVGYLGLSAAEVPVNPADIVSFPTGYTTTASSHGSAVAEVVADMAPGASLTLIAVGTTLAAESAVDYVIKQGFNIVVMALGTVEGPFDGTHPLSLKVNSARAAGTLWVNAAGNFAQRHWEGTWGDTNNDGVMDFGTSGKDYILLNLPVGTFDASLSWFETAGWVTDHDYDLVLTDNSATGREIARSAITQNGKTPPREPLRAYVAVAGLYRLKIQHMSSETGDVPDKFQLYTPLVDMDATSRVKDNSLAIPAEASGAFAVGAVRGSGNPTTGPLASVTIDQIEPFSSRGPVGSTTKPAMVGPDSVVTSFAAGAGGVGVVDGLNPFLGTSAAAAHVAGGAALLFSEDQSRSAPVLEKLLVNLAKKYPVLPPADVNAYGGGRLALRVGASTGGGPPQIVIAFPQNNATITIASPRILATITDDNGVNATTIQVWLDSTQVVKNGLVVPGTGASDYDFTPTTGELQVVLTDLTRTRHTVSIQATDSVGNVADPVATNFRVTTPVIAAGLRLISLPYPGMANKSPQDVFGIPNDEIGMARWVPADSRVSKYHVYPDDFATFAPPDALVAKPPAGLGYFLRLPRNGIMNVSASSLTDASYQIKLVYGTDPPRGWNLIGNPYGQPVDWGSVEFISSNGRQDLREAMDPSNHPVTEGVLFQFVPTADGSSGFYSFPEDPTQASMVPLEGYWVHVLKDATLVIHNPGGSTAAASRPSAPAAATPSTGNWLVRLEARAGKYEDPTNYLGVSTRASDGYDAGLDVSEPPPLVDALSMYVPKSDWGPYAGNYAKDVRGATGGKQEWEVEVSCRLRDVPVTVSWPRLNATVPQGVQLRLVDQDSGATVYMRTSAAYTFTMSEPGIRHLRVVADQAAASALVVNALQAATVGGGGAVLSYSLSREAEVAVEIRNIAGVLIRSLPASHATAGTAQTAAWNGVSERGTRVPSGRYLARLTARTADGQTVQALRPFTIGR